MLKRHLKHPMVQRWMVMGMREKLIELLINSPGLEVLFGGEEEFAKNADFLIANGVTIPVRCKDCDKFCPEEIRKLYNTDKYCMRIGCVVADDDFCSCGERRTDDRKTG